MASLASVSADVEASLAEIQKMLREEQGREKEFQEMVGPRPSSILVELEKETQKYHEAHSMASESNLTLNKVILFKYHVHIHMYVRIYIIQFKKIFSVPNCFNL